MWKSQGANLRYYSKKNITITDDDIKKWLEKNRNVHSWVADGYKIMKKTKKYRNEKGYYDYGNIRNKSVYDDFTITTEFIHMNWGLSYNYYKVVDVDKNKKLLKKTVIKYSKQEKNDGWCTYDYWNSPQGSYDKDKGMITVKPRK